MNILKATMKDLSEIEKLNDMYFHEIRDFKKVIEGKDDYFFVGKNDSQVVGFSGLHVFRWNNTARIIDIFIHPNNRREGNATEFLKKIKKEAKKLGVRAIIAEAPSFNPVLTFYLQNGFRVCGFNDRYYSNNGKEMAIFLSFDITSK